MFFLAFIAISITFTKKDNRLQMGRDFTVVQIKSVSKTRATLLMNNEQVAEVALQKIK